MATEKRLDLVEREAVKDAIGFMNLHFLGHGENKSLLDSINEVPTVDAVEVVRCKDCKFWGGQYASNECSKITKLAHPYYWLKTSPEDFCSIGERKYNGY